MIDRLTTLLLSRAADECRARLSAARAMLICCLLLATAASAGPLPCELRQAWPDWGAYTVCAVDADGDSVDEIYTLDEYAEYVGRRLGEFVWFRRSPVPRGANCSAWTVDLTGDGTPEIVVALAERETISVYIIDADSGRRRRLFVQGSEPRDGAGPRGTRYAAFADLNGDGVKDMVFSTTAGYEWPQYHRAVFAVDARTGKQLWRFGMGPNASAVLADDVDEDGKPEVFISTYSPGNGCAENGTNDASTYVICLDDSGRQRWIRPFRSGTGGATVAALTREPVDGRHVLVVTDACSYAGSAPDSLVVLDASSGDYLRSTVADGMVGCAVVADLNGDRLDEIVSAEANTIVSRNLRLSVTARRRLDVDITGIALCDHLLGRRERELAVASSSGELYLLNNRLAVLARSGAIDCGSFVPWEYFIAVRRGPGRPMAIVTRNAAAWPSYRQPLLRLEGYKLLQTTILPRPFPWVWVSAGLGVLLLGALTAVLLLRQGYREQVDTLTRGLAGKAGVVRLGWRGQVAAINDNARAILGVPAAAKPGAAENLLARPEFLPLRDAVARVAGGHDKQVTCQFILGQDDERHTYLAQVSRLGFRNVLVGIENQSAAEYARRVLEWAPVAQKLAHDIKNPLTAMSLALRRVEKSSGPESDRYVESMKEDIDRLKKMTDGFMRLTKLEPPSLQPTNLNELARECLARFEDALPTNINIVRELAEGLPAVALDRQQFVVACANVVENAVAAMTEKGGTLRVATRSNGDSVALVVSDTGKGIPERYLAKVFEPYFTMKPGGTGLGMYLTKRIIEEHKGTIAIESVEGQGTQVTIRLPAVRQGTEAA